MSPRRPGAERAASSGRRRPAALAGALLFAVVLAVVAAFALESRDGRSGSDAGARRAPSSSPSTTAGGPGGSGQGDDLTGAAAELTGMTDAAGALTFHARYETLGRPQGGGARALVVFELWNKPPRARRDTVIARGNTSLTTREIAAGDGSALRCLEETAGWKCSATQQGQGIDPADTTFGLLRGPLAQALVRARDEEVGGRPARCFAITGAPRLPADVCVSREGILLRVDTEGSRMELTVLEFDVADEVFTPPKTVAP